MPRHLPDAEDDAVADGRRAAGRSAARPESTATKLKRAVDAAFEPAEALTAAFVVTYKGRLIGERYGPASPRRRRSRAGRWARASRRR